MESSYLIQRLQKPYAGKHAELANVFSFGGGLKNGGLTDEAMSLLNNIFIFDYVGAAEFEFGALPESLQKIYENRKDYIGFNTKVKWEYDEWSYILKRTVHRTGEQLVYIICHKEWQEEVKDRVTLYSTERDTHTKEAILLNINLFKASTENETADTVGWLELDNGYFFFIDKKMFEKTCALFDIVEILD